MSETLYDRLGGAAAILAAVDLFYRKVLTDERTRPFFDGLDMEKQIQKQVAFMTWAFGGPAEDRGRDLRAAHSKLVRERGLSDVHFDAVAELLGETLRELGVGEGEVTEALSAVGGLRTEVLGR
jgi:hemoglobin